MLTQASVDIAYPNIAHKPRCLSAVCGPIDAVDIAYDNFGDQLAAFDNPLVWATLAICSRDEIIHASTLSIAT
jgi:hypothetical protein